MLENLQRKISIKLEGKKLALIFIRSEKSGKDSKKYYFLHSTVRSKELYICAM